MVMRNCAFFEKTAPKVDMGDLNSSQNFHEAWIASAKVDRLGFQQEDSLIL